MRPIGCWEELGDDQYYAVGDRVRYGRHEATVKEVYRSGSVRLEWTGQPPHPFFHAPYAPHELERLDDE